MYIKQITISNFRSFKRQPEIQPFAPTTNVVVGRNGSGKSNLFDAVQFVLLSPRFATLRSEERQALLHEGSGSAAVNAFVEVVFDNSDNRFSLENSDEVVLRRTVGSKKDEFFLQRKRATKQEVMSLLEGAGFSKSNPYFMVQQGKIQTLCTMTDAQRLKLLQEVAGTTLYEDKKAESLSKMKENQQSIDKINEILADIDQRLTELRGETEELTAYQAADRQRKALEYTVYDKELRKARHVLDHLEHDRMEHALVYQDLHEQARTIHDNIQNAEATLRTKSQALKRNVLSLQHLESDKTKAVTSREKLKLECQELEEQVTSGQASLKQAKRQLKLLDEEIAEAQIKQEELAPQYKREHAELGGLIQEKDQAQRQMDALYAKQGQGKRYRSKAERDKTLKKQIKELQTVKADKEQYLTEQQVSLADLRKLIEIEKKDIDEKKAETNDKSNSLHAIGKELADKQKGRAAAFEHRKQTWREAETMQEQVRGAQEHLQRCILDTRKTMPRATALGLKHLKAIVAQERLVVGQQYFGMLMENMTLKDRKYQTAVEVAAQNSLFHVIVDSDATAARLMHRLEEGKLGRVTFLPLNRLRTESTQYPQSPDVAPILQTCIDFDPKLERAMMHVFDKKLLAKNAEVASEWSSKVKMDCITLEGDLCSRKGALTGGYVDQKKSRLRAFMAQETAQREFEALDKAFRDADKKARQAEQDVTDASQEVSQLQHKQAQLQRMESSLKSSVDRLKAQLERNIKHAEKLETSTIPPLEREIAAAAWNITRLQQEIGTELSDSLSEEERSEIRNLKSEIGRLSAAIEKKSEVVDDLTTQREQLDSLLTHNLLKRRQELTETKDLSSEDASAETGRMTTVAAQEIRQRDLAERKQEYKEACEIAKDIDNKLEESRRGAEKLKDELNSVRNHLEKLKNDDMKVTKQLEDASEKSESLMGKKSMNISKRETYMRKIQELGSLPSPAELEAYKNKHIPELMSALEKVNKKLKKYSHVNKKAFDQYVNFNEQRDSLLKRKDELDRGAEKVKELVESLDRKKDEAINRTFRGVKAHFEEVFKELVPLGGGQLIMRTAMDDDEGHQETDDEAESEGDPGSPAAKGGEGASNNPDVSLYKGIGIKVWFSDSGENFIMSQLSGGQKALVALALIFAIQRCDPAPFYIFDELDQALDSTYRSAVANLIQRQANNSESPTQFILSTFRPEIVNVSRNCYGISHQNKESKLHHMSKSDALKFVANLMSEEEKLGAVSTFGSDRRESNRKRKADDEPEGDTPVATAEETVAAE